jgi:Glycosyltransferase Family 4
MLATMWLKRVGFAVAQLDLYSGLAFIWAEAVGASLAALRRPYVVTVHSGAFLDFAARWPERIRHLLQSATVVTAPSAYLQEQLRCYRSDIHVIHSGSAVTTLRSSS